MEHKCLLNPMCKAIIEGEVGAKAFVEGLILGVMFTFGFIGIFKVIKGVFFG